ncbi:hypothetical protein ACGFNU_37115 [Spirillospora sp. NPDC048911]|uniref:hypothetical protein n=1 Tax=Spirillospora sp. NPDC048911 TaxID=3364527 RepID=UPI00371EB72B
MTLSPFLQVCPFISWSRVRLRRNSMIGVSAATERAYAGRYVVYPLDGPRGERWVRLQIVSTGAGRLVEVGEDGPVRARPDT